MKFGNIVQGENLTIFDKDRDTAKLRRKVDREQRRSLRLLWQPSPIPNLFFAKGGKQVATRKDLFGCYGESPWLARRIKLKTHASSLLP